MARKPPPLSEQRIQDAHRQLAGHYFDLADKAKAAGDRERSAKHHAMGRTLLKLYVLWPEPTEEDQPPPLPQQSLF